MPQLLLLYFVGVILVVLCCSCSCCSFCYPQANILYSNALLVVAPFLWLFLMPLPYHVEEQQKRKKPIFLFRDFVDNICMVKTDVEGHDLVILRCLSVSFQGKFITLPTSLKIFLCYR